MGIGEAVQKGFLLSKKLVNVVLIFFVLNVVMGLISLPLARPDNVGKPGIAAASFALSIVFFVIFIFLQGGALGLVRDIYKTGDCQISNFAAYGKKYYSRILGLLLLYVLIAIALVLVLALVGSGVLALANNNFTKALVATIVLIVGVITVISLLYPVYSIVADDNGIVQAVKQGVRVSWNAFWRTFLLFLVLLIIGVLISVIIGFIIGLITVPLPFNVTQVIITILNSAIQAYLPVVMMIALMGYYLGLTKGAENPENPAT